MIRSFPPHIAKRMWLSDPRFWEKWSRLNSHWSTPMFWFHHDTARRDRVALVGIWEDNKTHGKPCNNRTGWVKSVPVPVRKI